MTCIKNIQNNIYNIECGLEKVESNISFAQRVVQRVTPSRPGRA